MTCGTLHAAGCWSEKEYPNYEHQKGGKAWVADGAEAAAEAEAEAVDDGQGSRKKAKTDA